MSESTGGASTARGRVLLWSVVAASITALIFAPLGEAGSCPSGGDCVIFATNLLGVPVLPLLWIPVSIGVGLATAALFLLARRRRPEAGGR